jgi:hypothetical protein
MDHQTEIYPNYKKKELQRLKDRLDFGMMSVFNPKESEPEKVGWYRPFDMAPDEHWWLGK